MSADTELIELTRDRLLKIAVEEAKENFLAAAFLGWLLKEQALLDLLEAGANQCSNAKGAERSSRSVAALGFALGIKDLRPQFVSEFASQLEWALGRPNFVSGGEPCGFITDPVSLVGVVVGDESEPNASTHERVVSWANKLLQDAAPLMPSSGWRHALFVALRRRIEGHAETNSPQSIPWVTAALNYCGWLEPFEYSPEEILHSIVNTPSEATDGFEAGLRLAALNWALQRLDHAVTLVFSGGGLRATLFQLGAVAHLVDTKQISRVSGMVSVSGGSILAAQLVSNWRKVVEETKGFETVASNLLKFARSDIRHKILIPWLWSRLNPLAWFSKAASRNGRLKAIYDRQFPGIHLGQLNRTEIPQVAFVATEAIRAQRIAFTAREIARFPIVPNLIESGRQTYSVAESTGTPISLAVAASSCFPPVFPRMNISHEDVGLHFEEWQDTLSLNDGGVIGNLGIEVLLSLHKVRWEVASKIVVFDAERPQGERPSGPLVDIWAQMKALSVAATDHAKQLLNSRISFIRLAERQDSPPGLSFQTQTALHLFRTDLDAPSWQECHALMLHGYAASIAHFSTASDHEQQRQSGQRLISGIIVAAGYQGPEMSVTEADLKTSKTRPKLRVAKHALAVLAIALGLLFLSAMGTYKIVQRMRPPRPAEQGLVPPSSSPSAEGNYEDSDAPFKNIDAVTDTGDPHLPDQNGTAFVEVAFERTESEVAFLIHQRIEFSLKVDAGGPISRALVRSEVVREFPKSEYVSVEFADSRKSARWPTSGYSDPFRVGGDQLSGADHNPADGWKRAEQATEKRVPLNGLQGTAIIYNLHAEPSVIRLKFEGVGGPKLKVKRRVNPA